MHRLISMVFVVALAMGSISCAHKKLAAAPDRTEDVFEQAGQFYAFIIDKEIGIWHNDRDEKLTDFFLDRANYYDFMDSFLYVLRDRNIYRNTITQFYIQDIELSEDGSQATVKVKMLSRDAFLLYRKIDATHVWEKTYDKWYPKKISAPELNWYRQYTQRYGLPPRN